MSALLSLIFFPHPAPTETSTLSLHDALPISLGSPTSRISRVITPGSTSGPSPSTPGSSSRAARRWRSGLRSEEHTSELQSRRDLVCRLLLEKKKRNRDQHGSVEEAGQRHCRA